MCRGLNICSRRSRRSVAITAALLTLAACDQSEIITRVLPKVQPNGSFTATIDGASWRAGGRVGVARADTSLTLIALSPTYSIAIDIGAAIAPGTYDVGDVADRVQIAVHQIGASAAAADYRGGSGTISIATLTPSRITGTFNFVAMPAGGAESGPIRVSSGAFDLTY